MQQQILQRMQQKDPQKFEQIRKMIDGKSDGQLKEMAENIARERGIDLGQLASQLGLKL